MPNTNLSLHLAVLVDLREIRRNSSSEILSSVSAVKMRSAIVFSFDSAKTRIWSCFLALTPTLRPMNFSPAPSNPHTIAPACKPTTTGTAMIVDNRPMPKAANPTLAAVSAVSSPSATLAPRRYFFYSEALKSRSFSRRDLTSATC